MTTEMNENITTTDTTAGITAHPDRAAAIARLAAKRAAYQGVAQHTEPEPAPAPAQPTAAAEADFEDIEDIEAAGSGDEPDPYTEIFDAYEEGDTDRFRAAMQRRDQRVAGEILTQVEQRQATERFMDEFSDIAADRDLLSKTNDRIVELQRQGVTLSAAARQAGAEVRQAAQRQGRLRATRDTSTAAALARMKAARGQRS